MPISSVEEAEELYFESHARMFSILLRLTSLWFVSRKVAQGERVSSLRMTLCERLIYLFAFIYAAWICLFKSIRS